MQSLSEEFRLLIQAVATGIIVGLATLWSRRKANADKKEVKTVAAEAKTVAAETKETVDSVYKTINGSGLLGAVKKVLENQGEHETKDEERFKELTDRLTDVEQAVGLPPKMDRRSSRGELR